MTTRTMTRIRYGAVAVAAAPAVMAVALTAHPFIARLPDADGVAAAVAANTTLWGLVHVLTGVGSALVALAFLALRAHLRASGEDRYSAGALPFVLVGSVLYAFLPGLEFAPLAAARTGGDAVAVQASLQPWFVPVLATSALAFAVGVLGFAKGVAAAGILGSRGTAVVVTALVVLALSRLVPLGAVQFYVQALAGVVALWPLAYRMWERPEQYPARDRRHRVAPAGM